jgi:hypothetical protein
LSEPKNMQWRLHAATRPWLRITNHSDKGTVAAPSSAPKNAGESLP